MIHLPGLAFAAADSVAPEIVVVAMILIAVVAFLVLLRLLSRNYMKVAPNECLVVYGRRYRGPDGKPRGFKLITGGAAFIIPLLESYKRLPLDAIQIKPKVSSAPSEQGVTVTVGAVATFKVDRELHLLEAAVTRFLNGGLAKIEEIVREVLEAALRGVVATMTIEQLIKERAAFGARVQEEVKTELEKLGVVLDNFLILEILDEHGYIDALGKKQTAVVKRDAAIGESEAERDREIRVAQARREADINASEARRAGETAKAEAEKAISDANKDKETRIAQNNAFIASAQARVQVASQIAIAEESQKLNVAVVRAEEVEIEARTKLQEKERERHDAELRATIIVEAERTREATVIRAEGDRQATVIKSKGQREATVETAEGQKRSIELQAEADKTRRELTAEGEKNAAAREAEGRKAKAAAEQTEMEAVAAGEKAQLIAVADGDKAKRLAEAEGDRARRLAEAEGERAKLLAEAEGSRAKLLAEAEGVLKKAEAYERLDATGRLLEILEAAPVVIAAIGAALNEAGQGTVAPMSEAIGKGLANIDELRIVDFGGNARNGVDGNGALVPGGGGSLLSKYIDITPQTIFKILQEIRAAGLEDVVAQAFNKAGIDLRSVLNQAKTPRIEAGDDDAGHGQSENPQAVLSAAKPSAATPAAAKSATTGPMGKTTPR